MEKSTKRSTPTLAGLPQELHTVYEELVQQYSWHTTRLFGRGFHASAGRQLPEEIGIGIGEEELHQIEEFPRYRIQREGLE